MKNLTVRATAPALLSQAPSRRKNTHHTHSCLNLQACNPTHVLPARRRGGGPALTYFLLLLEVLISMQNSASRQKLSLGSGLTSASHRSSPHRSHQFQPGRSPLSPVPAPGRCDLVLPASTENCRVLHSGSWPGKGVTCSLG